MNNYLASGSWRDVEDVFASLNAVSKLPRAGHPSPPTSRAPPRASYSALPPHERLSEYDRSFSMGRGGPVNQLSTEEDVPVDSNGILSGYRWGVEEQRAVQEDLQLIYRSGWSANERIEERFGGYQNQPLYNSFLNGNGGVSFEVEEGKAAVLAAEGQFQDASVDELPSYSQVSHSPVNGTTDSPAKKPRKRRCKNFVLLNLTNQLKESELKGPALKAPGSFQTASVASKNTNWDLEKKQDYLFKPEEFPAL